MDILGYVLDMYQRISLMDMWLGYLWICLDVSWISPVDISSWISLKDILFCQKISKRYLFISFHIQRYPDISNHIQRYPNGANSQMPPGTDRQCATGARPNGGGRGKHGPALISAHQAASLARSFSCFAYRFLIQSWTN